MAQTGGDDIRILGVDFGDRRTGVAVSDPFGWTAQSDGVITGDIEVVVDRLCVLSSEYRPRTIVIGYPLNMNGTAGPRAEKTDRLIAGLCERLQDVQTDVFPKPTVIKWDERLTSVSADRTLREAGVRTSTRAVRKKGTVDVLSAVILLQSYLDNRRADGEI